MKKSVFTGLLTFIFLMTVYAQAVYVDSKAGDDKNPGTKEAPVFSVKKAVEIIRSNDNDIYILKMNPGIYVLDSHISVTTEKEMIDKRIVIEASVLPDDPAWTPEKMPVIANKSLKGEIPGLYHWVVSFLIDESHVTIRGIKFHGYFYPHTRYFPVARVNSTKTDLLVEQCVFAGDANISQIQANFVNGNEVKFDHCIFYKVRNTVVFGGVSGDGMKTGNGITNSIIYGASQGVWTGAPDKDFVFENNIVTNCRYVWVKNDKNTAVYSMNNCVVVNNQYSKGVPDSIRLKPGEFELTENNVIKNGEITLRLTGIDDMPTLDCVDKPLPIDYMHVIPDTPGYEMGAGLFKSERE